MSESSGDIAAYFDKRSANYERYMGGCTRDVARHILSISPQMSSSSTILDNGCGSGIITEEIMENWPVTESAPRVDAVDKVESMIRITQSKVKRGNWQNVTAAVMDADEITFPDDAFSHCFFNFVIFFVPDAVKAAGHVHRTLKPGGTAIITAWDDLGYDKILQEVGAEIRPDLPTFKPRFTEGWYKADASHLESVLRSAGFDKISMSQKETALRATDIDALASLLSESFAWVTEQWTDDEKRQWLPKLKEAVKRSPSLLQDGSDAAIRMRANVAVAVK